MRPEDLERKAGKRETSMIGFLGAWEARISLALRFRGASVGGRVVVGSGKRVSKSSRSLSRSPLPLLFPSCYRLVPQSMTLAPAPTPVPRTSSARPARPLQPLDPSSSLPAKLAEIDPGTAQTTLRKICAIQGVSGVVSRCRGRLRAGGGWADEVGVASRRAGRLEEKGGDGAQHRGGRNSPSETFRTSTVIAGQVRCSLPRSLSLPPTLRRQCRRP